MTYTPHLPRLSRHRIIPQRGAARRTHALGHHFSIQISHLAHHGV